MTQKRPLTETHYLVRSSTNVNLSETHSFKSLQDAARYSGLNPDTLSQNFKKKTARSPFLNTYLTDTGLIIARIVHHRRLMRVNRNFKEIQGTDNFHTAAKGARKNAKKMASKVRKTRKKNLLRQLKENNDELVIKRDNIREEILELHRKKGELKNGEEK